MLRSTLIFFLFLISTPIAFGTEIRDAVYYSDAFEGARTSLGDTFFQSYFSAAICGIPLGEYVSVRTAEAGVVVKVNDRPNCEKYSHLIDLSKKAFQVLAPLDTGKLQSVQIQSLGKNGLPQKKQFFATDYFSSLGIVLDQEIPNIFISGESYRISGKVSGNDRYAIVYLQNQATLQVTDMLFPVGKNGRFDGIIEFPKNSGEYVFVIASGHEFETSTVLRISVIENTLDYGIEDRVSSPKITKLFQGEKTMLSFGKGYWGILRIEQGGKSVEKIGNDFILSLPGFQMGEAVFSASGSRLSTASSLDRYGLWNVASHTVLLDRLHERIGQDRVGLIKKKNGTQVILKNIGNAKIRDTYYITFPNGEVKEYRFDEQYVGGDGYLNARTRMNFFVPLLVKGVYKLEIVKDDGTAYVNLPLSLGEVWEVVPPVILKKKVGVTSEEQILNRINVLRASLDQSLLLNDAELTKLAEIKLDHMLHQGYVGHIAPDGEDIIGLVDRSGVGSSFRMIGENIASGNVSEYLLQDGLEESGSHRFNMLFPDWTHVGVAVKKSGKDTFVVQIFGK